MGYMVVTAVLVVTLGRIGDIYGRVRMYNLGFLVFTLFSILLSLTWMNGTAGALYLIVMRVLQGVGGAMLLANSSAILTDAFPPHQRGMALGPNMVAAIAGSFIGLVLGGVLGPIAWQLVFLVSVPVGLFGTVWAFLMLRDNGRRPARIDWWGNLIFAVGLVALLVGITYGILPYGRAHMGWGNPLVLTAMLGGVACLALFAYVETRVRQPMFHIGLFRIRAFAAGNLATLLSSLARGGLMFILIIWLQGIWLPQHGFSFEETPLWAGIYMLPMTAGFLIAGPLAGILSDRYGSRLFATRGWRVGGDLRRLPGAPGQLQLRVVRAAARTLRALQRPLRLPQPGRDHEQPAARRAGRRSRHGGHLPELGDGALDRHLLHPHHRRALLQPPPALLHGLVTQGVPASAATRISHLPAVGSLFASFLGYNPMASLLGPVLPTLSHAQQAYLTGRAFFPHLISGPFMDGLKAAFDFAIAACAVAAIASFSAAAGTSTTSRPPPHSPQPRKPGRPSPQPGNAVTSPPTLALDCPQGEPAGHAERLAARLAGLEPADAAAVVAALPALESLADQVAGTSPQTAQSA